MPIQTFLSLIAAVIATAGLTIGLAYSLGLPSAWLGPAALVLALAVRGLKWY